MRGGRNNNQKAKEKKKRKKHKLPETPSQDGHSKTAKDERRNKVFPASCACFSSRSSSACLPAYLPTCLSDSRCDFLKHFCMLLRGCVQRADFARGRQVRNEEDDDGLCGTLSVSLAISGIRTFVQKYVYGHTYIHPSIHNIQALRGSRFLEIGTGG
jgi:hypothetical protein